jgi:threonine/homoserine/homoserine lactone efflux protein
MENKLIKKIFEGFKFGMILQFAVGPVCLYVFKISLERGLLNSILVVLAAALIDAFYIICAISGVSTFLKSGRAIKILTYSGFSILLIFGLNIIFYEISGFNLIPVLNIFKFLKFDNPFLCGIILTLSSPLTIVFWFGVFSTEILESGNDKKEVVFFGAGCFLATLIFLSIVSITGAAFKIFLPVFVIKILNITVGLIIIYFGIKLLFGLKDERVLN